MQFQNSNKVRPQETSFVTDPQTGITRVVSIVKNETSSFIRDYPTIFAEMVLAYRSELKAVFSLTPEIIDCKISDKGIEFVKEYAGESLTQTYLAGNLERFIDFNVTFALQSDKFGFGFDPKYDNYVLSGESLVYVDFVFPYCKAYLPWIREKSGISSCLYKSLFWFYYPGVLGHLFHDLTRDLQGHDEQLLAHARRLSHVTGQNIVKLWEQCDLEHPL